MKQKFPIIGSLYGKITLGQKIHSENIINFIKISYFLLKIAQFISYFKQISYISFSFDFTKIILSY